MGNGRRVGRFGFSSSDTPLAPFVPLCSEVYTERGYYVRERRTKCDRGGGDGGCGGGEVNVWIEGGPVHSYTYTRRIGTTTLEEKARKRVCKFFDGINHPQRVSTIV